MQANGDIAGWVGRRVSASDLERQSTDCEGILRAGGLTENSEVPFHIDGYLTGEWVLGGPSDPAWSKERALFLNASDIITLIDEEG